MLQDPDTPNLLWREIRWGAIWHHAITNLWYSTLVSEATQYATGELSADLSLKLIICILKALQRKTKTFFCCIVICDIGYHSSICKFIHLWRCHWRCQNSQLNSVLTIIPYWNFPLFPWQKKLFTMAATVKCKHTNV